MSERNYCPEDVKLLLVGGFGSIEIGGFAEEWRFEPDVEIVEDLSIRIPRPVKFCLMPLRKVVIPNHLADLQFGGGPRNRWGGLK